MMESQNQYSNGGMEGVDGRSKEVKVANKRSVSCSDLVLRLLGLALTLVSAIVLGVDKQTKVVPVPVVPTLPPLNVPVTAKWHYLSAFVYLVVVDSIACSYAALSLLLGLANMGGKKSLAMVIITLDLVMVALLFSGSGATAAVGIIGYQGNSHVQWQKVCNVFDKFCHQVGAAIFLSLLGALVFFFLVVLAALDLHKKHK